MIGVNTEKFLIESFRIEGITIPPSEKQLALTDSFVNLPSIELKDVENIVHIYQPEVVLRDKVGLNVRVGSHIAPSGGPEIKVYLERILSRINGNLGYNPYEAHQDYETLHPFTDGNGRSGRAIWLWHMNRNGLRVYNSSFLHTWYYQILQEYRK